MVTLFGSIAVGVMLASYWLEPRSRWFVLSFAGGCASTAAYSALVEAWPVMAIEAAWALVAITRFMRRRDQEIRRNAQVSAV